MVSYSLILLSGGIGKRLGSKVPKQYLILDKKPVALHSFDFFLSTKLFSEIAVVCSDEYQHLFKSNSTPITFAKPGKERFSSLKNGFKALTKKTDFVLSHDAARPLVDRTSLLNLLKASEKYQAATLATKLSYTIKEACNDQLVTKTHDRRFLWTIQTPQLLSYPLLEKGFELINIPEKQITDDVTIAELLNEPVKIVEGCQNNIKITHFSDLSFAQKLIHQENHASKI